jgi:hypothetical protein
MIIKDLIEKLQTFDENLSVFVDGYEYGILDLKLTYIDKIKVKRDVNENARLGGPHEIDDNGDIDGIIIGRSEFCI